MTIGPGGRVTPNAPQTGWTVLSQQETSDLDFTGRPVIGYRIYFQTARGQQGSVFVPQARYTPDNVKAAIADLANRLDQALDLKGP